MAKENDHDILIVMRTDVKYIRRFVKNNTKAITKLAKRVDVTEDWQEEADTKMKIFVAIATTIGGVIVFIGNKLWDYLKLKRG